MGFHPSGSSKMDRNGALGPFSVRLGHQSRLAENEPPDSANCLGMFGMHERSEGSTVDLTSKLTGVPGSKTETSYRRVVCWSLGREQKKNWTCRTPKCL